MNIIGDVALFTHGTINGNRTRRERGWGKRDAEMQLRSKKTNAKKLERNGDRIGIRTDTEQRKRLQYNKDDRKTT